MKRKPRQYAQALYEATRGLEPAAQRTVIRRLHSMLIRAKGSKLFPSVIRAFETIERAENGRVAVRMTTSRDVPREATERTLASALGLTPDLEASVDPALLGGAVVQVGDTRIDGSIKQSLNRLRKTLTTSQTNDSSREP